MKIGNKIIGALALVAVTAATVTPASAHGWDHGHGGWGGGHEHWDHGGWGHRDHDGGGLVAGIFGAAAGLTIAAATLATAPVRVVADAASGPVYAEPSYPGPAPAYVQPAPVVYAQPAPVYYYHPHRVVYAYPQPVYAYPY